MNSSAIDLVLAYVGALLLSAWGLIGFELYDPWAEWAVVGYSTVAWTVVGVYGWVAGRKVKRWWKGLEF